MGRNTHSLNAKALSALSSKVLEPALAKRSGMTLDLLTAWPDIAGEPYAHVTRPQKIKWPKRLCEDDPFEPATLVIACEPAMALFLQHEETKLVESVNRFFGFRAIARLKIEQKPIAVTKRRDTQKPVLEEDARLRLENVLAGIEDTETRERMRKLGEAVFTKNSGS